MQTERVRGEIVKNEHFAFLLYHELVESTFSLANQLKIDPYAALGTLVYNMTQYSINGSEPSFEAVPSLSVLWPLAKHQVDDSIQRHTDRKQKNSYAGYVNACKAYHREHLIMPQEEYAELQKSYEQYKQEIKLPPKSFTDWYSEIKDRKDYGCETGTLPFLL